jgi:hypothetical protein
MSFQLPHNQGHELPLSIILGLSGKHD